MHAKRIIPCLDVNNGRVVKGTSFVNLRDAGDPVEVARIYDKAGADELVFLDITASSDARNIKNYNKDGIEIFFKNGQWEGLENDISDDDDIKLN